MLWTFITGKRISHASFDLAFRECDCGHVQATPRIAALKQLTLVLERTYSDRIANLPNRQVEGEVVRIAGDFAVFLTLRNPTSGRIPNVVVERCIRREESLDRKYGRSIPRVVRTSGY